VGESDLSVHLQAAAKKIGIVVQEDPEPERNIFIRSDQYSFIKQGVPALFLSFGSEPGSADERTVTAWFRERYHAPSDDLDQPVNVDAAARFNQLMHMLAVAVANADKRPQWKEDSFFRTFAQQHATPIASWNSEPDARESLPR
jgi:Zn-dependent M28 family amino/carboxypeptidase